MNTRRLLLGGTALLSAAVALAPVDAAAADKISLGVGGYFTAFFVVGEQDDGPGEPGANRRNHKIAREAEIHFRGESTLDNGLTFGVNVQLEAETCRDQIDESYIYVEGGFGRIEIGSEDPASDAMYYGSPSPIVLIGLSSPLQVFSSLTNAVRNPAVVPNISDDAEKITYFTPRLAGLQVGASYTPENCEEVGGTCGGSYGGLGVDNDAGQQSEIVEIAANYLNSFNGIDVALYGGYVRGDLEVAAPGADDQTQWGVGVEIGVAGFTIGAAYKEDDQGTTGSNTDRRDMSVGVNYATGPWTVGIEYVHSVAEAGAGLGEDETDGVQFGGTYDLGPGIELAGAINYWDVRDNLGARASENEAIAFIVGTIVRF